MLPETRSVRRHDVRKTNTIDVNVFFSNIHKKT